MWWTKLATCQLITAC